MRSLAVLFLIVATSLHQATADPVTLFSGTGSPVDFGWLQHGSATTLFYQNTGTPTDVLTVGTAGAELLTYGMNSGFSEFLFNARVRVNSANLNQFDAGFMLSVFGIPTLYGSDPDRRNSFYLTSGSVGFMDLGSSVSYGGSGQFHDFSILVQSGQIQLFIDQTFPDILDGTAASALSRPVPSLTPGILPGVLAFGDQTNDADVNSQFEVDEVTFQGIAVPEPSSAAIGVFGAAFLFSRRKRV